MVVRARPFSTLTVSRQGPNALRTGSSGCSRAGLALVSWQVPCWAHVCLRQHPGRCCRMSATLDEAGLAANKARRLTGSWCMSNALGAAASRAAMPTAGWLFMLSVHDCPPNQGVCVCAWLSTAEHFERLRWPRRHGRGGLDAYGEHHGDSAALRRAHGESEHKSVCTKLCIT